MRVPLGLVKRNPMSHGPSSAGIHANQSGHDKHMLTSVSLATPFTSGMKGYQNNRRR